MRNVSFGLAMHSRIGIWGKLKAENANDLSDETLDKILGRCIGGAWIPLAAKILRDKGLLDLSDNQPAAYVNKKEDWE